MPLSVRMRFGSPYSSNSRVNTGFALFFQVTPAQSISSKRRLTSARINRSEFKPEFSSAPLEVTQKPVTVTFFVDGFSLIDIAGAVLEHAVQYPGQFVGGRREGFGGTETSFEATEVRTKGRLTLVEGLGCQTRQRRLRASKATPLPRRLRGRSVRGVFGLLSSNCWRQARKISR